MFLAFPGYPKPGLHIKMPGPPSRIGGPLGQENRGGAQLEVQASVHGARRSLFSFFFFFFFLLLLLKKVRNAKAALCADTIL